MKFYLCLPNFSELGNLFSLVPMGNCFRCYFRQLFISLALRNCKKDCEILKIILVPDFCPLKTEIARFSIGFCLNSSSYGKFKKILKGLFLEPFQTAVF